MSSNEMLSPHDDAGLEGGEWLFRRGGQVFGPIDSRALVAMLYRAEIDAKTQISSGDGSWRAIGDVAVFVVHVRKAEAGLRVQREVTGERLLRARRNRRKATAIAAIALLLVAAGVGVALHLARSRETSPLLEDFGAGIRIASAARVGVSQRADGEGDFEVPLDAPSRGAGSRRQPGKGPGATPASGEASADGLEVATAKFDAGRIQAVVGREQRTLVPCFRAEASRSPDFNGNVPIEFTIGNDGKVASLWIEEPRFRNGALRDCLVKALGSWRFEQFPGQRPTVSLAFGIGR